MKQNFEELMKNNWDQAAEVRKIVTAFENDSVACIVYPDGEIDLSPLGVANYWSYIDYVSFKNWKNRGNCSDVEDFLNKISYSEIKKKAETDIDSFILLIEIIYTFYLLYEKGKDIIFKKSKNSELKELLDDNLRHMHYRAEYDKEKEIVHIAPINPELERDDEILKPKNLKAEIKEYNSPQTRGNLKRKREILFNLGNEYEPKVKQLEKIYPTLEDSISFLLNKMNVRHNNKELGKYYCEKAATLTSFEQELIYDRLYNLLLLAFAIFESQSQLDYVVTLKQMSKKNKNEGDNK